MKIETIAVPTDFSESSICALKFAAGMAKKLGAAIKLVHVYQRPYTTTAYNGGLSAAVDPQMHKEIRQEIINELRKISENDFLEGVKVIARLITDIPAWKMYEELDNEDADIIVMGTHGMTGLLHGGLIGTNTERVIRHSPMPVISVPDGVTFNGINHLLFATNFQEGVDEFYKHAVDLAKAFDADLEVAVINTQDSYQTTKNANENYEVLKDKVPYEKSKLVIYNEDSVTEGIRDLSLKHHIDLIMMMTHGRTGFRHFLQGSITEDVSATVKTPVMALKTQNS